MEGFRKIFHGVDDPRKNNATKHELIEILVIALLATLQSDQVAIDGKVLRGAIMDALKQSALHLVQAFKPVSGLVLGQVKVGGESNETTAAPALLEILALTGRTVTADARRTRREASAQTVEKGGDYVLPEEGDQKALHEDVQVWFSDPEARKEMRSRRHVGAGHGRMQTRAATVSQDAGRLRDRHDWPGLKAVGKIEAIREQKGKEELPVRTYIMSAEISSERMLELVRNRWPIENGLHWVLDVVMDKYRMRNRTLNRLECLATLRRIVLKVVRLMSHGV